MNAMTANALLRRLPATPDASPSDLLDRFLDYVLERGLELYPAQEEAILELFEGNHVILNTPTGSGKSLVATALHFQSLAMGRRSVYTCPIKALVNEKFLALCRDFGPENVGLATGDATVNRDAPILCCTAEILANQALAQGAEATFRDVVMDEFHYYSDLDRGVAWQVPLLTMSKARFLLMSATLGSTAFFEGALTKLTGAPTRVISSVQRPVPLEFRYVNDTSLETVVLELVEARQAPVYIVHFTQNDAAQTTQDLLSANYCTAAEKAAIAEALEGVKFTSPYGKEMKRYLRHGIGLHHAGLLPKYRVLVEGLAQRGLLKIICGTDTLGVGVNVPIRTVLLTKLSKFGGQKTAILSARDFHQITGRAGRKGFDNIGYVVGLAPEHVIENAKLEAKAAGDPKKLKKIVKRKPPDKFVGWSEETFMKLQAAPPEPLVSRFQVTHAMLLHVLSRPEDGRRAMQRLIRDSHETQAQKRVHRKRAWQLFRSLVERQIIVIHPRSSGGPPLLPGESLSGEGRGGPLTLLGLNVNLQDDFSLNHALSLYLLDTLALLDVTLPSYPLDVLTLIESILENPEVILRKQLDALKTEKMAELKNQGMEYEDRIAELEAMEYPKPQRDFIYNTFNAFAAAHPWVGPENIRPKSIVREMVEDYLDFAGYIHRYKLERSEGVLLRHLSSVAKVLSQTVPLTAKTPDLEEIESWLTGLMRGTDSSLLDEWEKLRDPNYVPNERTPQTLGPEVVDITRNAREFTALVRTEIFAFLRAVALHDYALAATLIGPWSAGEIQEHCAPYFAEHERLILDPEARNRRHTYISPDASGQTWLVQQTLVDADGAHDWQVEFNVSLAESREGNRAVLHGLRVAQVGH